MKTRLATTLTLIAASAVAWSSARADFVWPGLVLESRMLSLWVIPAGLLCEFVFLRWWVRLPTRRAIGADLAMNAASAAVGALAIPAIGLGWALLVQSDEWILISALAVVINTVVEAIVLLYVFKVPFTRGRVTGLALANGLSVGLAMASLRISYPRF